MNILNEIKSSVYDKSYYQSVISLRSFRSSFNYLIKLILIISLVATVIFAFRIPYFSKLIKENISIGVNNFPDDLVVSFKNGNASVNKPEPYIMKLPESWLNKENNESQKIENLVVVNTKDPLNTKAFFDYSTVALITKSDLVVVKDKYSLQVMPISKIGEVDITKPLLLEKQAKLLKILPTFFVIAPFIFYIFSFIGMLVGTLFTLIFYALVVWIVSKFKKINLNYKKSYQVGMHVMTLSVLIGLFSTVIGFHYDFIFNIIIIFLIAYINLPELSKTEVVS